MPRASSTDLPDDVLVPVAHDMKSDMLALVLASMNPDNAKALTIKLANRLALPQATAARASHAADTRRRCRPRCPPPPRPLPPDKIQQHQRLRRLLGGRRKSVQTGLTEG